MISEEQRNAASVQIMLDEAQMHAKTIRTDGITSLILLPWRSQFVYDTQAFLNKKQWPRPSSLPDSIETGIRKSRLSLKYNDDRGTTPHELIATCIQAEDAMRRKCLPYSFANQPGWDTGIFYDAKSKCLAGTTTASCLWSGFDLTTLFGEFEGKPFTFAYGYYIGQYIAELSRSFGVKISLPLSSTQLTFRYRDVRANEYYNSAWNPTKEDKQYLRLVSSVACLVAAARLIRKFSLESPILEIKMSLCGLLHGANTLRTLILGELISEQFRQLLEKVLAFNLNVLNGYRNANKLRNVLFHYGIPEGVLKAKYTDRPYAGMFESIVQMDSLNCLIACQSLVDTFWQNLGSVIEIVAKDHVPLLD